MASTINAKNTSSGLVLTPDASGQLELQTADTTRMTIDVNGNVGVGTSSPTSALHVYRNASGTLGSVRVESGASAQFAPRLYLTDSRTGQSGRDWGITSGGNAAGALCFDDNTAGLNRMVIDSSGNVGIGTTTPNGKVDSSWATGFNYAATRTSSSGYNGLAFYENTTNTSYLIEFGSGAGGGQRLQMWTNTAFPIAFGTNNTERMRIDSSGNVLVGTTTANPALTNGTGATLEPSGVVNVSRNTEPSLFVNRKGNDGNLVIFCQDGFQEGSISVSGTTVSYNGGHISRWSQLYNETTKVEVYRGTVLESVDAMCEWYDAEGNLLPNEQSTKTIVSTTPASKAVAGVFDTYDNDDVDNPYDFYVAQSGDFIIRLAAGTVVQNGDLLESAGDGTARVQADDICRSSTIAKVTSNYVSATYDDGSFCVPCILMIG